MWFWKKREKEIFSYKEIAERQLKLAKEIGELPQTELESLIINGKDVPETIKIKLYDFLVEYNILDSIVDKMFKASLGIERDVSSNSKGINTTLNELFKNKDKKLESFLITLNIFDEEELPKKLVTISDAIKLRDRIAHAIPIWHQKGNSVLFHSYDGVFWNKLYNQIRQAKSEFYKDEYFKKELNKKVLPENGFSYVLYHVYQINFLTEKIRSIRLSLIDDLKCDK